MIEFDKMQVGETLPLSTKTDWKHPDNCGAYLAAQEHTLKTRALFSIDTVYKDTPAGSKIAGFTITRTR